MKNTLINIINTSRKVKNDRTILDVVIKAGEEMGEVMSEVSKISGHTTHKEITEGDLEAEIADTIIALIDLVMIHDGFNGIENLLNSIDSKLQKWAEKY